MYGKYPPVLGVNPEVVGMAAQNKCLYCLILCLHTDAHTSRSWLKSSPSSPAPSSVRSTLCFTCSHCTSIDSLWYSSASRNVYRKHTQRPMLWSFSFYLVAWLYQGRGSMQSKRGLILTQASICSTSGTHQKMESEKRKGPQSKVKTGQREG